MVSNTCDSPEAQIIEGVPALVDANTKFKENKNSTLEHRSENFTLKVQPSTESSSTLESIDEEVNTDMQLTSDSYMNVFGKVTEFMSHFEHMRNILRNLEDANIPNPKIFLADITDVMTKIHEESGILLESLRKNMINF